MDLLLARFLLFSKRDCCWGHWLLLWRNKSCWVITLSPGKLWWWIFSQFLTSNIWLESQESLSLSACLPDPPDLLHTLQVRCWGDEEARCLNWFSLGQYVQQLAAVTCCLDKKQKVEPVWMSGEIWPTGIFCSSAGIESEIVTLCNTLANISLRGDNVKCQNKESWIYSIFITTLWGVWHDKLCKGCIACFHNASTAVDNECVNLLR